ncbi:Predicted PurR-regulated permease PerM [Roseomonas rosea]|uniref:Predicted PurR-regulated permease PerM n=1 Tax=Muricoccus roseus TaxID=198092 RepID=A0A1M6FTQ8_9PROT|nr:AI-2E family transporter [Roseomonas rosea]SHJ01067.1 Predicted PurR-regulated permease PerM [Roseomonas rosea]
MPEPITPRPFRSRGSSLASSNLASEVPAAGVPSGGPGVFYAGIAIVGVLYFTRELLVPLAMAVLLAFVLAPVVKAIRRLGVPRVAAELLGVILAVGVLSGVGALMGRQLADLANELPYYQATITQKLNGLFGGGGGLIGRASEMLQALGENLARRAEPPSAAAPQAGLPPLPVEVREPTPGILTVLQRVVGPLLGPVATTGIVIVFVVFLLLYREDLRDRLIKLMGSRDLQRTTAALNEAASRLSRYFLAQTALNTGFGIGITIGLWAIGIPNPLLWGVIAGLMRFVPFIGGFIAAAFPVLLAIAVDPGWTMLIWVVVLFGLAEPLMGQVFEPLVYGHSTGLSPVAVLLATAFWAWLWGPIGLLLATPLTVGLVVLGRHVDRLEFLDVLLGDRAALEPPEAFYQRALAGDGDGLAEQAELQLRGLPLQAYYDTVALPGLALAQGDATRGALTRSRLDTLRTRVDGLLDDLSEHEDTELPALVTDGPVENPQAEAAEPLPDPVLPPAWQQRGAVLCVAGRGRLDEQATVMLAQVLALKGFGVTALPNEALRDAAPAPEGVQAVILSALDGGSGAASARYTMRRLRRRFPEAALVAGLWGADRDSPVMAALREAGGGVCEARSLRDALQCLVQAVEQEDGGI